MRATAARLTDQVRVGMRGQSKPYYFVLGATLALVALGLVMVASASSVDALRTTSSAFTPFRNQSFAVLLGLALLTVSIFVSWTTIARLAPVALVTVIAVQFLTATVGSSINGNRNWIQVAGLNIQPSEFLKVTIIAYLAMQLARLAEPEEDASKVLLAAVGLPTVGLALVAGVAGDLGSGLVIAAFMLGMVFVSGVRLSWIISVVLAVGAAAAFYLTSNSNRMARFNVWLDPTAPDPADLRWQTTHASWAFAEGGIFGTGLGQSKLKWNWIPEVENDFIFAVVGEELGLIGTITVVGLYLFLAGALLAVARRQTSFAAQLFVSGVMLWILFQALVNIGVVLTVFPVLGVTLPLMSQGGSSMLATLLAIGMVLGVERNRHNAEERVRR